jgi:hypothetical protein
MTPKNTAVPRNPDNAQIVSVTMTAQNKNDANPRTRQNGEEELAAASSRPDGRKVKNQ